MRIFFFQIFFSLAILLSQPLEASYIRVFQSNGTGGGLVHKSSLRKSLPNLQIGFFQKTIEIEAFIIETGALVNKDVFIGNQVVIRADSIVDKNVTIDEGVKIGVSVRIGRNSRLDHDVIISSGVAIGHHATVHSYTKIKSSVTIEPNVIIGRNSVIGKYSLLEEFVKVGNNVVLGNSCVLSTQVHLENHVHIDSHVSIGQRSLIKSGAAIERHATLGESVLVAQYSVVGERANLGNFTCFGERSQISSGTWVQDGNILPRDAEVFNADWELEDESGDSSEEAISPAQACVICLVKKATHIAMPCRHFNYCKKCLSKIETCAICRSDIECKPKVKDVDGQIFSNSDI